MRRALRAVLITPLWLLQLLRVSKSFEHNPIIGCRLLNRLVFEVTGDANKFEWFSVWRRHG